MYKKARRIFWNFEVGDEIVVPAAEGLKLRAHLHVVNKRNEQENKVFKTKVIGKEVRIWRKA